MILSTRKNGRALQLQHCVQGVLLEPVVGLAVAAHDLGTGAHPPSFSATASGLSAWEDSVTSPRRGLGPVGRMSSWAWAAIQERTSPTISGPSPLSGRAKTEEASPVLPDQSWKNSPRKNFSQLQRVARPSRS